MMWCGPVLVELRVDYGFLGGVNVCARRHGYAGQLKMHMAG